MACTCNKPDCVECLVQTTEWTAPSFLKPGVEAIIFTVRVPKRFTEIDRERDANVMWSVHRMLEEMGLIAQHLGLKAELTTRRTTPK